MFDVSFSEISLIGFIALLVLGPKEMMSLYKSIKRITTNLKASINKYFKEAEQSLDEEDIVEIIIDQEGNPQKAYKLEKIMPYLNKDKDDK